MNADEARERLEVYGAILSGHFELSSGRHSDLYVQKARILERPQETIELAREMASWYPEIDVVVAPAVGAVALGFAVALAADARSIFAERQDGRFSLRRGFKVERGERALVVEDVITTGGSAGELPDLRGTFGAERLGVAALVDRSVKAPSFPLRTLLRIEALSWEASACPMCRRGIPVDSPGSRGLQAS
jgi:orotate phosphoribosyltransferase